MSTQKYAPRGRLKASSEPMEPSQPMNRVTCKATNRQGRRCGKPPIPGGVVCRMHGGASPQVKAKALERLKAYQDQAVSRLFELAEQTSYPSTALAAVKDVLDRTMGKALEQVDLNVSGDLALVPTRLAEARKRLAKREG